MELKNDKFAERLNIIREQLAGIDKEENENRLGAMEAGLAQLSGAINRLKDRLERVEDLMSKLDIRDH